MNTVATNKKIYELLSDLRRGKLQPRPEFQRRLVWTNKDKRNFLKTVLQEYPFPEIYIAAGDVNVETGEATEMLVDGQQRITTLDQYFNSSEELILGNDVLSYSELSNEEKTKFLEYVVVVRDLGKRSIEEIKEVFSRINSTSYSLNAMELHNARYNGEFKQFGEAIASDDFFEKHRVFSATEIRRMEDTRFVLTLIITMMSTYFTLDSSLEEYLRTYNDEFEQKDELRKEIKSIFDFMESCGFGDNSRVWKKADLFTLLVELHRALIKKRLELDPKDVGNRLKEFYKKVDQFGSSQTAVPSEVGAYYTAALQGTNNRGNRVKRGQIIEDVIQGASWLEMAV